MSAADAARAAGDQCVPSCDLAHAARSRSYMASRGVARRTLPLTAGPGAGLADPWPSPPRSGPSSPRPPSCRCSARRRQRPVRPAAQARGKAASRRRGSRRGRASETPGALRTRWSMPRGARRAAPTAPPPPTRAGRSPTPARWPVRSAVRPADRESTRAAGRRAARTTPAGPAARGGGTSAAWWAATAIGPGPRPAAASWWRGARPAWPRCRRCRRAGRRTSPCCSTPRSRRWSPRRTPAPRRFAVATCASGSGGRAPTSRLRRRGTAFRSASPWTCASSATRPISSSTAASRATTPR